MVRNRVWLGVATALFVLLAPSSPTSATDIADVPVPTTQQVAAGLYVSGSDRAEREAAYALDRAAYGHDRTRQRRWYENEPERANAQLAAFRISATAITNTQYAAFIAATGHRSPDVDRVTWQGYQLVHPFERTRVLAVQVLLSVLFLNLAADATRSVRIDGISSADAADYASAAQARWMRVQASRSAAVDVA